MRYVADLHVHSYLSRATSKNLNLEELYRVAQRKGITVVGTGDFTHPKWLSELGEKLVPAEPGLFALRPDLATAIDESIPLACRGTVRFMLSVEISNIYKRGGKVRKVHNLVYAPDLPAATRIATRLGQLGNVTSDGRPILGLDSRDLLEITLEASPDAFLIPAHVWTPWFSALGAESGFDAVDECFADLAPHIFAIETGLSSDPLMNWRLRSLDRFALVSSSDAHSPEKLGREANLFDCELSYHALRDALATRKGFLGTLEFFPEEGKYHFDGHRKCGVVLTPDQASKDGRDCPVCKAPLTRGVYGRVAELADRPHGERPDGAQPFSHMVQLCGVLGEVFEVGAASKRVAEAASKMLERLGPELSILQSVPLEEVAAQTDAYVAEAIARVRRGALTVEPGYDGVYGVVKIFSEADRRQLKAQGMFGFSLGSAAKKERARPAEQPSQHRSSGRTPNAVQSTGLTDAQRQAVEHVSGPLLIVAGPGTGKTRTLSHRIAHLVRTAAVSPRAITAFSFTRKAAAELAERVEALLGDQGRSVGVTTFHAFGLELLRTFSSAAKLPDGFEVLSEERRDQILREVAAEVGLRASDAGRIRDSLGLAKAKPQAQVGGESAPDAALDIQMVEAHKRYASRLEAMGAIDMDDLVVRAVALLETSTEALAWAEERSQYLFVDEYQDINAAQVALIRQLARRNSGETLCAVGDPDQAIYAFRGSDPSFFARFQAHFPGTQVVTLSDNFRSASSILDAASTMISRAPYRAPRPLKPHIEDPDAVDWVELSSPAEEASFVARQIAAAMGSLQLETSGGGAQGNGDLSGPIGFGDIAVLFRLSSQADRIAEALEAASIPYERRRAAEPMTPAERETLMTTMAAGPSGGNLETFIAGLWMLQHMDMNLSSERVALLSLHASKGLEFSHVFVVGCEEGLLPLDAPGLVCDVEEERRLLYVGMTRAKHKLVLTSTSSRQLWGRTLSGKPTPLLEHVLAPKKAISSRKMRAQQLSLF